MGWFRRKYNISRLAAQLEHIERVLRVLERNGDHLPSMTEMRDLALMQDRLPELTEYMGNLEKQLWERITTWQNTPYTPAQMLRQKVAAFIGWWIAGTMALAYSVLGWFAGFFPEPWHIIPVSAILSLIAVSVASVRAGLK